MIDALKNLLAENYISSLLILGCMVMSMHMELVLKERKACAMGMAIGSTKCGKTTALNCAASLIGSRIWGTGTSFSVPAVMEFANSSTMGYCLDDVKDDKTLKEIVIDTYNQGGYVNLTAGRKVPKCMPVPTSNYVPICSRVQSRLVMIPFASPKTPLRGMARMAAERDIIDAQEQAEKGVLVAIKLGTSYEEPSNKEKIYGELTEFVMEQIGEDYTRESINYAEVIGFTDLLCQEIGGPPLEELTTYFRETVAPFFRQALGDKTDQPDAPLPNTLSSSDVMKEIVRVCKEYPREAVRTINPSAECNATKEKCIAFYLPDLLKLTNLNITEALAKKALSSLLCSEMGCMTKHQSGFIADNWKVEVGQRINVVKSGPGKNAKLKNANFVRKQPLSDLNISAICEAFDSSTWGDEMPLDEAGELQEEEGSAAKIPRVE